MNIKKIFDVRLFKLFTLIIAFIYIFPVVRDYSQIFLKIYLMYALGIIIVNYKKIVVSLFNDYRSLILLFFISLIISVLCNFDAGFLRNIKDTIYYFIFLLILTYNDFQVEKESIYTEIRKYNNLFIFITFICGLCSFLVFFFNIDRLSFFPTNYQFSFSEGRLWGIYANPNTLAELGLLSIFSTLINLKMIKCNKTKFYYFINIIIQFYCICLANSRTVFVTLILVLFVALLLFKESSNSKRLKIKKIAKILSIIIVSFFSLKLITYVPNHFPRWYYGENGYIDLNENNKKENINITPETIVVPENNEEWQSNNKNDANQENKKEEVNKPVDLERIENSEVSNGRFEIWKAALKTCINNSLFGVGQSNLQNEIISNLDHSVPENKVLLYANMHNIYIQILTTFGIFSLFLFLLLVLTILLNTVKKYLKCYYIDKRIHALIGLYGLSIFSILIINIFDSNLLGFMLLTVCVVFWTNLGYLMYFLKQSGITDYENNERKKIVFLINNFGSGGAEKILYQLIDELKNEYTINVFSLYGDGIYKADFERSVKIYSYFENYLFVYKRIVWRLIKILPKCFLSHLIDDKQFNCYISFLEGMPLKIIGSMDTVSNKLAWIHTNLEKSNSDAYFSSEKQASSIYCSFKKIIFVSESCRKDFLRKFPAITNTITIYNFLNKNQIMSFSEEIPIFKGSGIKRICTLSRLEKEKGIDLLIKAFANLSQTLKNVELVIVGEGKEERKLKEMVTNLNLDDKVIFTGFQKNPYIYLKNSDLFVCSSRFEGFSLAIGEAMILGIPVISTNCDGPSELLDNGKYGLICEFDDDNMYQCMKTFFNDLDLQKKLKNLSLERSEIFDKTVIVKKIKDVIEEE